MSQAPSLAKAAAKAVSPPTGGPNRLVAKHLRIVQRDLLSRQGGQTLIRSSVAVDFSRSYMNKYKKDTGFDYNACPRVIDAEVVHGDEQAFWTERRDFYYKTKPFYTVWDRQAHALILLTQQVQRAPTEAAFRVFALGFKMLQLPQLLSYTKVMLPGWTHGGMNVESLLKEVKEEKSSEGEVEKKTDKTPEEGKKQ